MIYLSLCDSFKFNNNFVPYFLCNLLRRLVLNFFLSDSNNVFFPFILIVFMVEAGVKTFSFCFF